MDVNKALEMFDKVWNIFFVQGKDYSKEQIRAILLLAKKRKRKTIHHITEKDIRDALNDTAVNQ